MKFSEWRYTAYLLGLVWLSGLVIKYCKNAGYIDGVYLFAVASGISFVAIFVLRHISTSKLSYALASIELFVIGVIGIAWRQWPYEGFVYTNYEVIIGIMALVQAVLLLLGGLYYGMDNVSDRSVKRVWMGDFFRRQVPNRCVADSERLEGET